MENFEYYNPVKVIFGAGVLSNIGKESKKYGKKAMIVTYEECGFFSEVLNKIHLWLKNEDVSYIDYCAVTANPLLSQARNGVKLCKEEEVDLVIALGGGSVMDCAKVIAAGVLYEYDLQRMILFSHSNITQIPPEKTLPTIMIPTLPATGSEMNPTAVITDDDTMRKSYVWEPCLYAKTAIMDPELTASLPAYQTACGALDIISHVIEAYLNGNPDLNLEVQEGMQEGVIRSVFKNLEVVKDDPKNLQARGALMWAASVALNGWLTSGTFGFTPMHQMGHVLSARYHVAHGATLSTMMPAWMRYFSSRRDNQKYVQLAQRVFGCSLSEAADKFEEYIKSYGVESRISQFGVESKDIEMLSKEVVAVSFGSDGLLNGNPKMTYEDIKNIYTLAL